MSVHSNERALSSSQRLDLSALQESEISLVEHKINDIVTNCQGLDEHSINDVLQGIRHFSVLSYRSDNRNLLVSHFVLRLLEAYKPEPWLGEGWELEFSHETLNKIFNTAVLLQNALIGQDKRRFIITPWEATPVSYYDTSQKLGRGHRKEVHLARDSTGNGRWAIARGKIKPIEIDVHNAVYLLTRSRYISCGPSLYYPRKKAWVLLSTPMATSLDDFKGRLSSNDKANICWQLTQGFKDLEKAGYFYGFSHGGNILLSKSRPFDAQLCDFGHCYPMTPKWRRRTAEQVDRMIITVWRGDRHNSKLKGICGGGRSIPYDIDTVIERMKLKGWHKLGPSPSTSQQAVP